MQEVISDILLTGEYSLTGLATYARTNEDVLFDILSGKNSTPTLELSSNLFALHTTVRRNVYDRILEKFILQYSLQKSKEENKEDN